AGQWKADQCGVAAFGSDLQRFIPSAEVRCMHFHGTEIRRQAPGEYEITPNVIREAIVKA
ncbi:MAG: hypothetical protein PHT33_08720, partial [bacterium]|nr:hypothetical protein [bacterium]